jgi:hypothetical protein
MLETGANPELTRSRPNFVSRPPQSNEDLAEFIDEKTVLPVQPRCRRRTIATLMQFSRVTLRPFRIQNLVSACAFFLCDCFSPFCDLPDYSPSIEPEKTLSVLAMPEV